MVNNSLLSLQERSSSSSSLMSASSYEGYSKPTTGALGDRMSAMKQAFQVEISPISRTYINHIFHSYQHAI